MPTDWQKVRANEVIVSIKPADGRLVDIRMKIRSSNYCRRNLQTGLEVTDFVVDLSFLLEAHHHVFTF